MHDLYIEITQRIVAALERGVAPWVRPWSTGVDTLPINACTRRAYRGINIVLLALGAGARLPAQPLAYLPPGRSTRGPGTREHGTAVVFWKLRTVEAKTEPSVHDKAHRSVIRCCVLHRVQHGAGRRLATFDHCSTAGRR
jgi:antirestriction protein ArdC